MDYGTALIVSAAVAAAIMLCGIADVLRLGRARFAAADRRQRDWILLIVLIGPFAVLLYAAAVRPQVAHPERYADDPADIPADAPGNASRAQQAGSDGASARPHEGTALAGRP